MYYKNFALATFLLLFTLLSGTALSQSSMSLILRGQTLEKDSTDLEHDLGEVEITVINLYCDTTIKHSGKSGDYRMRLPFNDLFLLCYYKPGFERKSVLIDTRSISKRIAKNGYQLEIDILMIPSEDPDKEQECTPVAIAEYHFLKNEMVFSEIDDQAEMRSQLEEWQTEAVEEREKY